MESGLAEEMFADLRGKGAFYRKQKYTHRYPHCWRCATELVYGWWMSGLSAWASCMTSRVKK